MNISNLAARLSRIAVSRQGLLKAVVPVAAAGLVFAPAAAQAQPGMPVSGAQVTAVQAPQASSCGWSQTLRSTHLYQGSTAVALLPQCTGLYVLCYFNSTPAGNDYEKSTRLNSCSLERRCQASTRRTVPERERMTSDCVETPRSRS